MRIERYRTEKTRKGRKTKEKKKYVGFGSAVKRAIGRVRARVWRKVLKQGCENGGDERMKRSKEPYMTTHTHTRSRPISPTNCQNETAAGTGQQGCGGGRLRGPRG